MVYLWITLLEKASRDPLKTQQSYLHRTSVLSLIGAKKDQMRVRLSKMDECETIASFVIHVPKVSTIGKNLAQESIVDRVFAMKSVIYYMNLVRLSSITETHFVHLSMYAIQAQLVNKPLLLQNLFSFF